MATEPTGLDVGTDIIEVCRRLKNNTEYLVKPFAPSELTPKHFVWGYRLGIY